MLEAADPLKELSEGEAIGIIDRFALQHRLPNGKTMLDQFLAGRPDLTAADREMLRGWRDPVEGIFEIHRKDRDSLVLLNSMTWSTACTPTWARSLSSAAQGADSCTSASCPSARSQAPDWSPARCRPTASLALRRSRRPRSPSRRNSPNWSTVIPGKSSKPGR